MPKVSNIYPLPNGTFRASVSLGFDPVTGKRIRKFKNGFKTQKEAQIWQLQIQSDFGKGALSTNSTMTFKKFLDDFFIPDYQSKVRQRTFDMSLSKFKRLVYFDNMKLSSMTAPQVKKWQNAMFQEGLSNNYIRSVHQILQQVLDLAVKLGMLPNNVAKVVGNVKKDRPKVDFWTVEEFQKFISTFDKSNIYDLLYFTTFWFFFMTGVRTSELQAIEWSKVNWDTGSVLIDCSMYYKNQKDWYITDTKSISGIRLIYLDDDTLKILKDWQKVQSEIGSHRFIFSLTDSPLVKSTLKRVLQVHSDYADVKSIRIHDLRHSHASFMLSLGMNDLEMQNRLGHADIKTTLGTYSHLRPNAMKEVANRLTGQVVVSDDNVRKSKFNGNQHRPK
ncbi:TPA: site-specific integrase [Streptococcus suis]|uniref:site-specific integrase n=1 Tax=Streptococcus suis TaxID=1307 RepID=UPI00240E1A34|nr:tyrosine-type recombinase/integrase [Streptococcus suis]WFA75369.1 tyrosine-type recombinase/integrase [Streptococcus suis]HEM3622024.1 site-specific integrase [Streptococcus suis]HEM3630999.1 site-specific integrase [Streptococcus suis]HEM3643926.1 site-specific integrase [Streptococcus suis]